MNSLKLKQNICINDPRLCCFKTFKAYINVFIKYIEMKDIKLILFENDPKQCIKNIKLDNKMTNIINLTKIYLTSNYNKYNFCIIPVYKY